MVYGKREETLNLLSELMPVLLNLRKMQNDSAWQSAVEICGVFGIKVIVDEGRGQAGEDLIIVWGNDWKWRETLERGTVS